MAPLSVTEILAHVVYCSAAQGCCIHHAAVSTKGPIATLVVKVCKEIGYRHFERRLDTLLISEALYSTEEPRMISLKPSQTRWSQA